MRGTPGPGAHVVVVPLVWLGILFCLRWKSQNYLLNANFGKMNDGRGGLFQVAGFAFHPRMFFVFFFREGWSSQVCLRGCTIRFFPGTCRPLHWGLTLLQDSG